MQSSFTSSEQELERLRRENKDIENVCYLIVLLITYRFVFSINGCLKMYGLRLVYSYALNILGSV